jgi:predicted CoA-binding protein
MSYSFTDANGTYGVMMVSYLNDTDAELITILSAVKTIALLGASPNEDRPSFHVMEFLLQHGYSVIPVNPGQAGKKILGQKVYASLSDISEPVDMVEVFRASNAVAGIVDEILQLKYLPKVLWTQLEVVDEAAAKRAQEAGLQVVMNRCPAIEYPRLMD